MCAYHVNCSATKHIKQEKYSLEVYPNFSYQRNNLKALFYQHSTGESSNRHAQHESKWHLKLMRYPINESK